MSSGLDAGLLVRAAAGRRAETSVLRSSRFSSCSWRCVSSVLPRLSVSIPPRSGGSSSAAARAGAGPLPAPGPSEAEAATAAAAVAAAVAAALFVTTALDAATTEAGTLGSCAAAAPAAAPSPAEAAAWSSEVPAASAALSRVAPSTWCMSCDRSSCCTRFAALSRLASSLLASSRVSVAWLCSLERASAPPEPVSIFSSSRRSPMCSILRRYSARTAALHFAASSSCQ